MSNNNKRRWEAPNPQQYIVQMKNLTSNEVYLSQSGEQKPVLNDNTLDICRGESWAVVGAEAFEVELLLQMMGCGRPFGIGSCKLVERCMMRKKRRILPHVFYVGDSMAVPNMNVLEYLMFATQHSKTPARERQVAILEAMLDAGCYGWSVTQWDEGARGTTQVQKQKVPLSSPALTQQYGPLSQTDSGGAPMFCPETSTSRFLSVRHTHRHSHQHHFYYSTKPEKCQSPFVIFSAISRKTGAAAVLPLPPFSTNTVTTYFGFSTGKYPVIQAWQYSVPSGAY